MVVRAAVQEAVDRARTESIPTLLEVRTYRFMGHSMSDAVSGTYRTKEELEEYLKRDPIIVLRTQLQQAGQLTDDDFAKLDAEVKGRRPGRVGLRRAEPGAADRGAVRGRPGRHDERCARRGRGGRRLNQTHTRIECPSSHIVTP